MYKIKVLYVCLKRNLCVKLKFPCYDKVQKAFSLLLPLHQAIEEDWRHQFSEEQDSERDATAKDPKYVESNTFQQSCGPGAVNAFQLQPFSAGSQ